ncbi:GTPase family protein [Prochlorothrix hollandica]|uniref:GTPase family protein n=1 Tax=Prochlorothrix hollandica TaxID=1223 RepID=UPI00333E9A61
MEIIKYYRHRGHIDEISSRYKAFSKLTQAKIQQTSRLEWKNKRHGTISYHAQVSFFGKSGYGKSSTVNAFFGNSILKTSDVSACTRECQSLDFQISPDCYLSLADFPGIGESEYRDKEYLEMYAEYLKYSTVVVYVVRADTRDYSIDDTAYRKVFPTYIDKKKVIFALNCCDKIEPINRSYSSEPTQEQLRNIEKKVDTINSIFIPYNKIISYSAETGWNMNELADAMVSVLSSSQDIIFE